MKAVLINSSFISQRRDYIQDTEAHFRIGIASLAAVARQQGHDIVILDPQIDKLNLDQIVKKILAEHPDYLGLPAYTEEIEDAHKIATAVKEINAKIVTIIGGQHVTALPQETLEKYGAFDIGCVGEGEITFREILDGVPLKDIGGIVYRNNDQQVTRTGPKKEGVHLDDLPFPAWDLYHYSKYPVMPVEPLRGCPFDCVFCFRCLGKMVRYKSPKRIVDEIEDNIKRYGFKKFDLKAGTFPLAKQHCLEFCDELDRRGLKIEWIASTRVNTIDEETMRRMKACGCEEISFGIESGDAKLLKQCGKGTTPQMAENVVKMAKKINFRNIDLNFILGLPSETRETLESTRRFALDMEPYSTSANFAILTPFPGTKVYDMAVKGEQGLRLKTKDWSDFSKQAGASLGHGNFQEKELIRFQTRLYLSYYMRSPRKIIRLFSFQRCLGLIKKLFV